MQTPGSDSSQTQAHQVCTSCKTRKRKCDKALPKCSPCSKRKLACDYARPEAASTLAPAASDLRYGYHTSDSQVDAQYVDLATMLFLDPDLLQHGQVDLPRTTALVPEHILQLLGDLDDIRASASEFFTYLHRWMPFISKKRFYDIYLRSTFHSRPEVVLLFLCIKLITALPSTNPRNPRTPLYHAAKHFHLEVEGSSAMSLPVLQAGVIVALYEVGHAIYPAAFLTIGACARYAYALGIHMSGSINTKRVLTLVELEERRRVWWAIVILDRFVNIGCPGRPFATANPGIDDLLPTDDAAWDEGIVRLEDCHTLSSPTKSHMNSFSLLCQAARLLGQVLEYNSGCSDPEDDVWKQLDRTLHSMVTASQGLSLSEHDQTCFLYSTLIALHAPWLYSESTKAADMERSQRARAVIEDITRYTDSCLNQKGCLLAKMPEHISPWGLYFAYRVYGDLARCGEKAAAAHDHLDGLRESFLRVDVRWNAAGISRYPMPFSQ